MEIRKINKKSNTCIVSTLHLETREGLKKLVQRQRATAIM